MRNLIILGIITILILTAGQYLQSGDQAPHPNMQSGIDSTSVTALGDTLRIDADTYGFTAITKVLIHFPARINSSVLSDTAKIILTNKDANETRTGDTWGIPNTAILLPDCWLDAVTIEMFGVADDGKVFADWTIWGVKSGKN